MKRRPGGDEEGAEAADEDGVCTTERRLLLPGDGGIHRVGGSEDARGVDSASLAPDS